MSFGTRRIGGLLVVALLATTACTKSTPALPRAEVGRFLDAWSTFDAATMGGVMAGAPPDFAALVTGMKNDLEVTAARFAAGKVAFGKTKTEADAQFQASLDLAGLGTWEYAGALHLTRTGKVWRVVWSPAVLHPVLEADQHFDRTRQWPVRAPILGANDASLASMQDVAVVGLAPGRIKDRAQVDAVLKQQLGVEPGAITAALTAPGVQPEHFVPIANVRLDRFAAIRPILEPVPGVFFQRTQARLSPSDGFAAHVLGRVGEITAERLADLKLPYVVGDQVGLSGLEAVFERPLAGAPSGDVRIVAADDKPVRTVFHFPGAPSQPIHLTIDAAVQAAAEQALAGISQPAALVAIDSSSGAVKAVISRPLSEEFNRALAGLYPPGSTFKVVTTEALLASGATPDTPAPCPPQATAGGQAFVNFEGEALGGTTLRTAFAQSCNTAFVGLVANLPAEALSDALSLFGFNRLSTYPGFRLPVALGMFPMPKDAAEKAAAAIGQGSVVASPIQMASVAAAVASGAWQAPSLIAPEPGLSPPRLSPLNPAVAASLRDLMAEVVRTGTGTAAAVPGQQVAGKTGTAEIGADPNQTHAWFIGFRGTLAFAVLVEKGGVGGRVAAPIAAKFLTALAP